MGRRSGESLAGVDSALVEALIRRSLETCIDPMGQTRLLQAADALIYDYVSETAEPVLRKPTLALFARHYDEGSLGLAESRGVEMPEAFEEQEFTPDLVWAVARIMRRADDVTLAFFQTVAQQNAAEGR